MRFGNEKNVNIEVQYVEKVAQNTTSAQSTTILFTSIININNGHTKKLFFPLSPTPTSETAK